MQGWVDRGTAAAETTLDVPGEPREILLRWIEVYVALISLHKGGPDKITSPMSDPCPRRRQSSVSSHNPATQAGR